MAKFKIGEIAIIVQTGKFPEFIGKECEIISKLISLKDYQGHNIIIPNTPCDAVDSVRGEWFIPVEWLRKKNPPTEDKHKEKDKDMPTRGDMDTIVTWDSYRKNIARELETETEKETV